MHKRSIKKHMVAVTAAALTISSVPAVSVYANDLPEISLNNFIVATTDSVTTKSELTDGAEFTLTYSGNIGNVTYEVTEGSAATVSSATGEVDFTEYGTVTVTATDANNDAESTDDDIKASITLTVEQAQLITITPTINMPEKDIVIEESEDPEAAARNAVTVSFTDGSGNTVPLDESDYVLNSTHDDTEYDTTYSDYYVTVSLTEAGAEKYTLSNNGNNLIRIYYIQEVTANISAETVTVPLGATEEQIKEAIKTDIKNGKVSFTYEVYGFVDSWTETANVDSYELNVVKNDNGTYTVSVTSITADRYRLGNGGSATVTVEFEKPAITPTINIPEKDIIVEGTSSEVTEAAVRNAVTVSFTDGSGNTVTLTKDVDYTLNLSTISWNGKNYDITIDVSVELTEAAKEKYTLSSGGLTPINVYRVISVSTEFEDNITVSVPSNATEAQIIAAIKKNVFPRFWYDSEVTTSGVQAIYTDVDKYELNVVKNDNGTYTVSVTSVTDVRYKLSNYANETATVTVEFEKPAITPTIIKPEKDIVVETVLSEEADAAVRNAVTVSFTDGSGNTVTLTKDVDYTLNVPTIELGPRVRDVTIDVSVELTEAAKEKYTLSSDGSTPINVYLAIDVNTDFEDNITVSVPSNATEAQIIAAIKKNVFPRFYYWDGSGGSNQVKNYTDVDRYELNAVKNDDGTYTVSVTSITDNRYRFGKGEHETATVTVEFEKLTITPTIIKPEKDIVVVGNLPEDADAAVRNAVTVSFTDESGNPVTLTKDVDYTLNVPTIYLNSDISNVTIDVSVELTEAAKEKYTLSSNGSTPINVYGAILVATDFEDNITVSVPSNATEAQIIAAIKENVFPRFYYYLRLSSGVQKLYVDVDSYELNAAKNDDGTYTVSVTSITAHRYRLSNYESETATVTVKFAETEYDNDSAEITLCEAMDSQVALNWSEVEGAQKYAIYMWSKNDGVKCIGTRDAGVTGAYIKGLTNGTKYGFLVRTYNGERWSDYEASDWVYAVPFSIPKPSITKCIGQTGRAALNWSAVNGAEQYAVYTYINGVYTCVGSRAAGVTGMYVKNLESGKKYGFLVRAKINGQWSSYTTADIAYADIL